MFNKLMLSALGLAAAVAAPIVYFTASDHWKGGSAGAIGPAGVATSGLGAVAPSHVSSDPSPGTPVRNLAEVFQFNVTPDWIMRRWPQVATGLGQMQLQGYRVPLVTGTRESDLAGSLTYYFNAQRQLQRIAFQGNTGDPRQLVGLLSSRFSLTWRATNDPGLAVYEAVRSDNRPLSGLRIQMAPVLKANEPQQRFAVQLVLERPDE